MHLEIILREWKALCALCTRTERKEAIQRAKGYYASVSLRLGLVNLNVRNTTQRN